LLLLHQKSNPRVPVPHFEKAAQIKTDYPVVTATEGQNGVNHERKKSRYQAGPFPLPESRTEKRSAIPNESISITGYKNRKYALRLLSKPARTQALLFTQGGAVKLKPAKPKPASRKGKKIYTDEVTAALRLVRTFFWYKCGKLRLPLCVSRWTLSPCGPLSALLLPSGKS
jgi:hypothetical protein